MRNYFLLLSLVLFSFCYEVKAQCYDKGSIVISEIYFDTRFGENIITKYHHLGEYIELYNSSNVAIDLKDWIIKDNHTEFRIGDYGLPEYPVNQYMPNTIIQPGGFKVVTFSSFYAHDHDSWYHTGSVNTGLESPMGAVNKFVDLFPQAAGHEDDIILQNRMVLYNVTDKVSLYNPSGRLVHEVSYNNGAPRALALEYMNIDDFSIDFDLIDTHISNGDGGVFNGAIGFINQLDPITGDPIMDPYTGEPIFFQSSLYQTSIYLSDEFAYYFDKPKTILIGQATPFTLPYSIPLLDVHPDLLSPPGGGFNYVHSIIYDINSPTNQKLSESRSYFDDLAKPTVSMSHNYFQNNTWATETTYDSFGRPLKSSFPAIICNSDFKKVDVLSNPSAKSQYLDTYYSNLNTLDPYQATATQPYTEVEYDKLNPGNVIKSFGGNKIETSPGVFEWKSGYSYTVPAAQEMYYLFGYDFFNGPVVAGNEEVITKFYKTVSVDANGVENVAFSDGEGKTLAVARSGLTTPATINPYPVHSLIGTQGYVDVCIPPGITSGITLIGGAGNYDVYNLRQNTGIPTTAALTGGNCYRIVAKVIPTVDPKVFVTQSTGVLSYSTTDPAGVKGISYNVNYYDYSFNIYDTTGRLKKSLQPNGFRQVYAATPATFTITAAPSYIPDTFTNFSTSYKYNTLGQLIEVNSLDEGTSKFAYRNDGQIRYSQSALQANNVAPIIPSSFKVSYTNYDNLSRPIESGVLTKTTADIWTSAVANVDNSDPLLPGTTPSERTFTIYDYVANTTGLTVTIPTSLSLATLAPAYASMQKNLAGNVAVTYKADTGSTITNITWYSYDIYGRVEWLVQYDSAMGNIVKTIDYVYDKDGNVKQVIFQKNLNTEKFTHQYTYDANSRLIKVETAAGTNPFTEDAQYNYNISGQLSRVRIGEIVQGIDYVYTLGGALKSINHPSIETTKDPGKDGLTGTPNASVTPDLFGITLDYFQGDYNRAGTNIVTSPNITPNYSGNIMGSRWATKPMDGPSPPSTTTAQQKGYLYNYNRNNWLKDAKYGTTDNSGLITIPTPVSPLLEKHSEQDLQYDSNGNITKLKRTNGSGTIVDDLTYDYTYAGTNRLNRVRDFVPNSPASLPDYDNDINPLQNSGNYVYNVLGQLISNIQEKTHYVYNTQGLVSEIRQGGTTYATSTNVYKFYYNELGHRIRKEVYTATTTLQNTTYYVLDASGNAMAIYYRAGTGGTIAQTELPIYGASRLGVYMKSSNAKNYQITDHLGNVRAVAQRAVGSNIVTTLSYADYYPFGEQLQGRSSASNYRYAYQGQELDTETGMEAFQLRMWDGRLGRWLSPDPYGQYASPYLGMGNNPVNSIDPDGGWETWLGAFWHKLWNGGDYIGKDTKMGDYFVATNVDSDEPYTAVVNRNFGGQRYNNNGYTSSALKAVDNSFTLLGTSIGLSTSFIDLNRYTTALNENKFILRSTGQTFSSGYYGGRWHSVNEVALSKIDTKLLGNVGKGLNIASKGMFYTQSAIGFYNFASNPTYENGFSFGSSSTIGIISTFGGTAGTGIGVIVAGAQLYYHYGGGKERAERLKRKMAEDNKIYSTDEMIRRWSCFVKGTKVTMADLSEKNIEDIVIGDKILSVNINTMRIEEDLVVEIPNTNKKYRIIEAKFSNGIINRFSPAHPYWVKGKGWCVFDTEEAKSELTFSVSKLEVGDVVLFLNNKSLEEVKVEKLDDKKEFVEMYNVEYVKKNHTFFANGILVHNKLE